MSRSGCCRAGLARGGAVLLAVAEVEQRGQPRIDHEHHAAPVAAVATRGSALGHELLAPEGDGPLAAVTGANLDASLVDELHGAPAVRRRRDRAPRLGSGGG